MTGEFESRRNIDTLYRQGLKPTRSAEKGTILIGTKEIYEVPDRQIKSFRQLTDQINYPTPAPRYSYEPGTEPWLR